MSLELKNHLAKYLNTGLKMKSPKGFRPNGKESTGVRGIVYLTGDLYADIENNTFKAEFKPILRHLSYFSKKNILNAGFEDWEIDLHWILNQSVNNLPYGIACEMFKNHFDVFGLIEKGLAIDINTL